MSEIDSLMKRMDAEFAAGAKRIQEQRTQSTDAVKDRERKIDQFGKVCDKLRDVWKPRLEAFSKKFGEKVKVMPSTTPSQRDVTLRFTTEIASVNLHFSASLALEKGALVLDYELGIIPLLMNYERTSRLEVPLDKPDAAAVGKWVDDRLIDFLKTYNAMFENEFYLKDSMVVDPIAGVRFPKHVAAGTFDKGGGKTVYFVSAETKAAFEKKEAEAKAKEPSPAPEKPKPAAKAPEALKGAKPSKP